MKYTLEETKNLGCWMIERIARNRETVIDTELGCDWDWVAGEVWDFYPGIVNEFVINDAIDLIMEAAKCSE
jgi:hypothetical protein